MKVPKGFQNPRAFKITQAGFNAICFFVSPSKLFFLFDNYLFGSGKIREKSQLYYVLQSIQFCLENVSTTLMEVHTQMKRII